MSRRTLNPKGFSLIEALVVIIVVAVLAGAGAYIYHRDHKAKPATNSNSTSSSSTQQGNKHDTATIPAGWTWYQNQEMGIKVAYPETWKINGLLPASAANGHDGLELSINPLNPQSGDPGISVTSFPAAADIKDVAANPSAVKVTTFTTGDGIPLILMGVIDRPSGAAKPTSMSSTACWPRDCPATLKDGRSLEIFIAGLNDTCQPHVACFTEINTDSANYSMALAILKTVTSL